MADTTTHSHTRLDDFRDYRTKMNERIMATDHLGIKRFFNLDTAAYNDGALPGKTKTARAGFFHRTAL